ncbi:MerR family transcriptional regulator [Salininema proteolyticum]|uniref:MerR family transcriptional regulator n=1 Tax=Salininema proteolyticum TaxID=1607685 RepID=A0ABV8U362_9ACTN
MTTSLPARGLSIRETADRTGFTADTLRYYEKIGLLQGIGRTSTGQRRFSEHDLWLLEMLKCLRDTGMPVAEMREFADLVRAGDQTGPERVRLLERHLASVDRLLADLAGKRSHITHKIDHYRTLDG